MKTPQMATWVSDGIDELKDALLAFWHEINDPQTLILGLLGLMIFVGLFLGSLFGDGK